METQTLLDLVSTILEIDAAKVSLSDNLAELGWDSLSNLSFIAEVDEQLGLSLDADELAGAESVSDLARLITSAKA